MSAGSPGSPFLDAASFESEAGEVVRTRFEPPSPFVERFAFDHTGDDVDGHGAERRLLLAELYDDELDDALYELVNEAASFAGYGVSPRLAANALSMQLMPLAEAIEGAMQRAVDGFDARPLISVGEQEIDEIVSRFEAAQPGGAAFTPAFQHFWGVIGKTLKKVGSTALKAAKTGIKAVASMTLGRLMGQLQTVVKPLIEGVLKKAMDRIPPALQPAARALAGKLPSLLSSELDAPEDGGEPAVDVGEIQREMNERVADVLLGEGDDAGGGAGFDSEASHWAAPGIADLDAARERFITDLEQLGDGDDPGPAVERFLPAVLPLLKLGVRIAGRGRVEGTLVGFVSRLIKGITGAASADALSKALVGAGLKLIGLELSERDRRQAAHAAVVATVEETVRQVAVLPDSVLDNQTLLEGSIVRAFEEAAASNLPPFLPRSVYRRRPDLVETSTLGGTWVLLPLNGPKRCKKFTKVVRARITPRMAMAIPTFGHVPLAYFLQEQLGLEPGEELEADVHLYESLPGTLLGEVARLDANGSANGFASGGGSGHASGQANGNGQGDGAAAGIAAFHPLTTEAAALLLGEPGLARQGSASAAAGTGGNAAPGSARTLAVGQRFYRLAIAGRRINAVPGTGAARRPRRRTSLFVLLDCRGDRVRLFLFLSERGAQELAATLRKQGHAGTAAAALKNVIDRGLSAAVEGQVTGRLRILHEALTLDEARGPGIRRVPRAAIQAFAARIGAWTLGALSDFLAQQATRFIAATENARDGVTLVITLSNPPGLSALCQSIGGAAATATGTDTTRSAPGAVQVEAVPGFTNG